MKRFILTLVTLFSLTTLILPVAAHAQLFNNVCSGSDVSQSSVCVDATKNQITSDNSVFGPNGVLTKVANLISFAVGIVAIVVIIIAGITMILASGDPTKIANSRNAIVYALVGLGIAVSAQAIIKLVIGRV